MLKKFAILISEDTYDLVVFLNDGNDPKSESGKTAWLVCEINAPREITSKVQYEEELYDEKGIPKEPVTFLV